MDVQGVPVQIWDLAKKAQGEGLTNSERFALRQFVMLNEGQIDDEIYQVLRQLAESAPRAETELPAVPTPEPTPTPTIDRYDERLNWSDLMNAPREIGASLGIPGVEAPPRPPPPEIDPAERVINEYGRLGPVPTPSVASQINKRLGDLNTDVGGGLLDLARRANAGGVDPTTGKSIGPTTSRFLNAAEQSDPEAVVPKFTQGAQPDSKLSEADRHAIRRGKALERHDKDPIESGSDPTGLHVGSPTGRTGGLTEDWNAVLKGGAFENVGSPAMAQSLAGDANLVARQIAEHLGGGPQTAALIMPQVEAAMTMIQAGTLGGGRKKGGLGPGTAFGTDQLALIESMVTGGGGVGTQMDPRGGFKQALKRARAGKGEAFTDPNAKGLESSRQQVTVTNAALLAQSPTWGPGMEEAMINRLNQAASDWLDLWVERPEGDEPMSYPAYLKSIGADKWLR